SAARAISRWPWFGVVTTTTSALPVSAFQSVELRSKPYRVWVSASRSAFRPAMHERTSSIPRGRSCWFASRMARGWAMPPMKPWPMTRTLTFFIARLLALASLAAPAALLPGLLRGPGLLARLRRSALRLPGPARDALAPDEGVQRIDRLLALLGGGPGVRPEAQVDRPPVVGGSRVLGQLLHHRGEVDVPFAHRVVGARVVVVERPVTVDDLDRVDLP